MKKALAEPAFRFEEIVLVLEIYSFRGVHLARYLALLENQAISRYLPYSLISLGPSQFLFLPQKTLERCLGLYS